jgi:hypothetical protein
MSATETFTPRTIWIVRKADGYLTRMGFGPVEVTGNRNMAYSFRTAQDAQDFLQVHDGDAIEVY